MSPGADTLLIEDGYHAITGTIAPEQIPVERSVDSSRLPLSLYCRVS
jgi:hypothetical protein